MKLLQITAQHWNALHDLATDTVLVGLLIFILITIAMDLIDYDSIIIRFFKFIHSLFYNEK